MERYEDVALIHGSVLHLLRWSLCRRVIHDQSHGSPECDPDKELVYQCSDGNADRDTRD
jgi:hypothetical protein